SQTFLYQKVDAFVSAFCFAWEFNQAQPHSQSIDLAGDAFALQLTGDRAQIALGRACHGGFRVGQDVRLPPAAINFVEREWFDSLNDAAYCRGSKRNEIWITSHKADLTAGLHHGNDVAGEQRAFAPAAGGRRRPMQHRAAFKMTTTVDEREIIPERKGCSFPELNSRTPAHRPLAIGGMQKYFGIESLSPLDHRRVKMRMGNGNGADAAARAHLGDGF